MILRTRKKSSLYGKCIRGDGKEIKESEICNTKGTCQGVRIIGVSVLSGLSDMKSRTLVLSVNLGRHYHGKKMFKF